MNEELIQAIVIASATSGGAIIKTLFDEYRKKRSKKEKAEILDQLYSTLEGMYAKDLALQKELNEKSLENEKLKMIINKLNKDGEAAA